MKDRLAAVLLSAALFACAALPVCAAEPAAMATPEQAQDADAGIEALAATVASGSCGTQAYWSLDSDGLFTVSGSGAMQDYNAPEDRPWHLWRNAIRSLRVEDGITYTGKRSFTGCRNLSTVSLADSVTWVGCFTFEKCESLTQIALPGKVQGIGNYVFDGCTRLQQVSIPASVLEFGVRDFRGTPWQQAQGDFVIVNDILLCYQGNAASVTIPDTADEINSLAFEGRTAVRDITVNARVWRIAEDAFYDCPVQNYAVQAGNRTFTAREGVLYKTADPATIFRFPAGRTGRYTPPAGVSGIGAYAFAYSRLTELALPDTVTQIGEYALEFSSLTQLQLPGGLRELKSGALYGCTALRGLAIPAGVERITGNVFWGCSALQQVVFYGHAPQFSGDPFYSLRLTAYYPAGDASWTPAMRQNYGGVITWRAYDPASPPDAVPVPLLAPRLTVENTTQGIRLRWNKVVGAEYYRVAWQDRNGNWWMLDVTEATTYLWKGVLAGQSYTLGVRAVRGNEASDYGTAPAVCWLPRPTVAAVNVNSAGTDGVRILATNYADGAEKASGATLVFYVREKGKTQWQKAGSVAASEGYSFIWTKGKSGTAYQVTVQATKGDAKSARLEGGKNIRYYRAPDLVSVKKVAGGIQFSWKKQAGVSAYRYQIMIRDNGGAWKPTALAPLSKTSYTWKGAQTGHTYKFSVRFVNSTAAKDPTTNASTAVVSGYNTAGLQIKYQK